MPMVNGNTGEFYALTPDEAVTMVHKVVSMVSGRGPVLAGIGRSVKDACRLAKKSAKAGAPAFYAVGARGFTTGLLNIWPEQSMAIHAALESGNHAKANHLIRAMKPLKDVRGAATTEIGSAEQDCLLHG